jgi:hypothetical protein
VKLPVQAASVLRDSYRGGVSHLVPRGGRAAPLCSAGVTPSQNHICLCDPTHFASCPWGIGCHFDGGGVCVCNNLHG